MKKLILVVFITAITILATPPAIAAQDDDNFDNFSYWDAATDPYEKVFPYPEMFYIFILGVLTLSVWMKTHSVASMFAFLLIISALLSPLIGPIGIWIFGVITAFAIGVLLMWIFKKRGG